MTTFVRYEDIGVPQEISPPMFLPAEEDTSYIEMPIRTAQMQKDGTFTKSIRKRWDSASWAEILPGGQNLGEPDEEEARLQRQKVFESHGGKVPGINALPTRKEHDEMTLLRLHLLVTDGKTEYSDEVDAAEEFALYHIKKAYDILRTLRQHPFGHLRMFKIDVENPIGISQNILAKHVFGVPLFLVQKYASRVLVSSYRGFDIPIIIYECIEKLDEAGLKDKELFKSSPISQRARELIKEFNSGPDYMPKQGLGNESILDIGTVLYYFLKSIPHEIMNPIIYAAIRDLCVLEIRNGLGFIREDDEGDLEQRINIARLFLKLLPVDQLGLLAYVFNLLSKIPLYVAFNELDTLTLAEMFAVPLLVHDASEKRISQAVSTLFWILGKWAKISVDLFDYELPPKIFSKEEELFFTG